MSSLTTLFGDKYIRDPRQAFNKFLTPAGRLYVKKEDGTNQPDNSTAFFTYYGASALIVASDTYVTIADITGAGFLYGVVSSIPNAGSLTITFRITVDGTVYTITGVSTAANQRLVLGNYTGYKDPTTTYLSEHIGFGTTSDWAPASTTDNVALLSATGYVILPTPNTAKSTGLPSIRFDTSLKVECKISTYANSAINDVCGATYKLDS